MNEEQIYSILKVSNILKELEDYSIKEDDIVNEGYCKYIKLVYHIIKKCLKEFESDISIIEYMYKISSKYDKGEISCIFNANNLNKIYLLIKNDYNIEMSINLDSNKIMLQLIYTDNEYLFVKFNKQEITNNVIYCNKSVKKKKTVLNNIYEIIDDINKKDIQENCQFLMKIKDSLYEIKKIFRYLEVLDNTSIFLVIVDILCKVW